MPLDFVQTATPDQVTKAATDKAQQARAEKLAQMPHVLNLVQHIQKSFEEAQMHKANYVTDILLFCKRTRDSLYEPDKLKKIKEQGGSETFFNITSTKQSAAEGWIKDIVFPLPWKLEPTPIPELPENVFPGIGEAAVNEFRGMFDPSQDIPEDVQRDIQAFVEDMEEKVLKEMKEQAKKTTLSMERKIRDQLVEGNFNKAFHEFLQNLVVYQNAFLKGPVIQNKRRMKWVQGKAVVKTVAVPMWTSPSPFDMFPSPNASTPQNGYIIEVVRYEPDALSLMRGLPGWQDAGIEAVVREHGDHGVGAEDADITGESDRKNLEFREPVAETSDATIRTLEFHGAVSAKVLREWQTNFLPKEANNADFYEIKAIASGRHLLYAVLNADPMDQRPYFTTSFEKRPGSFWGRSIAEKMKDTQDTVNATLRNLMNNLAFASGPMGAVDIDALPPDQVAVANIIRPWKMIQYHGKKLTGNKPIDFHDIPIHSEQLLKVSEYFEEKSDDRVGIPRFVHGNEDISGAGQTASGLSMLFSAAAKGIKMIIGNIEQDVLFPLLTMIYGWNLLYDEDQKIKSDAFVQPRGILAQLVKEQTQLRLQELMVATNNDVDMSIIGIEGRAKMLRQIFDDMNLPVDIVPDEEEIIAQQQAQEEAAEEEKRRQDEEVTEPSNAAPSRQQEKEPALV